MKKLQAGDWGKGNGGGARWIRHLGVAVTVAAMLGLGGCAISPTTRVTSVRSPDYTPHIERMFVVYDGDMRFGADFASGFREEMTQRLASCGVKIDFGVIRPLMLDTSDVESELRRFRPDVSLRILPNGGVVDPYGGPMRVDFLVNLVDMGRDTPVWRGIFQVHQVGTLYVSRKERGGVFATDLINRMITDRLIENCPILALDPGNRLPKRPALTGTPAGQAAAGSAAQPAKPAPSTPPAKPAQAQAPSVGVADKTPAASASVSTGQVKTKPPATPPTAPAPVTPTAPPSTPATPAAPQASTPMLPSTSLADLPQIAAPDTAPPVAAKPAPAPVESPPGPRADDPIYRRELGVRLDDLNGLLPTK